MKKILFLILVLILIIQITSAEEVEIAIHQIEGPSSVSAYEGEIIQNQFEGYIYLDSLLCNYDCYYQTSQGKSGYIGKLTPSNEEEAYRFDIVAQGSNGYSSVSVTAVCDRITNLICTQYKRSRTSNTISFNFKYCGDGYTNGNEECDKYDFRSKSCINFEYSGGNLKCTNFCEINKDDCYRCGDNEVNPNEECDGSNFNGKTCGSFDYAGGSLSCTNSCRINTNSCYKCGDGKSDPNENCRNCPVDAGCNYNEACNFDGGCISLGTDENCAFLSNNCGTGFCVNNQCVECKTSEDCISKTILEHTNNFICTSDYLGIYEILNKKKGECINNACAGSIKINGQTESCGNIPCQDGHCGCSEGYDICSKKCEKKNALKVSDPCSCDFQCESNYCQDKKCKIILSAPLTITNNVISVGEETKAIISADNHLDKEIQTKITLNLDSGAIMSGIIGGSDCSGNQCTVTETIPPKDRINLEVGITGIAVGNFKLEKTITTNVGKKEFQETETKIIIINDKVESNPNNKKLKNSDYIAIAIILFLILLFYFKRNNYLKHKKSKKKNSNKKKKLKKTK